MAAQVAEAQARSVASLREIITFFEESKVQHHSIEMLNDFIEKNKIFELLNLVEVCLNIYLSLINLIKHNR